MKPEDISRLNERIKSVVNPLANNPIFSNDWINNMSNIRIYPVSSAALEFSKMAERVNSSFYSQTFKDLEKIIGSSSGPYEYLPFNEIYNRLNFYNYDFSEIIEDYEISEEEEKEDNQNVKNIILDETEKLKRIIFDIYLNNQKLYEISPRDFEKMIAELLFEKGFQVELTKQTRDNGYDILALKYIDDFSPVKYLVECKRYSPERKVGVEIIRSFKEVLLTEKANKGIIVTTSYFTKDAIIKQQENPLLLDYKNKDEVMEWVKAYHTKKTSL